jgi:cap2 methyltransferase
MTIPIDKKNINSKCNYKDNPHINKSHSYKCYKLSELPRILKSTNPTKKYRSRDKDDKESPVHWGQRKLLMSEIEFLVKYGDKTNKKIIVIYAGGAPGDHIPFLSKLFPHIFFVLIDPSKFSIRQNDKITIIRDFLTNELCDSLYNKYIDDTILFISDIRSVDFRINDSQTVEKEIKNDMKLQMEFYKILNPSAGIFKFRLPWNENGFTKYLSGNIHLPVYGARSTTETRLFVDGNKMKMKNYDNIKYDNQMHYFNTETRNSLFLHNVKAEGLDCCYDCSSEVSILFKYAKKYHHDDFIKNKNEFVGNLVDKITKEIGGKRTLINWRKKNSFKKRIIDNVTKKIKYKYD